MIYDNCNLNHLRAKKWAATKEYLCETILGGKLNDKSFSYFQSAKIDKHIIRVISPIAPWLVVAQIFYTLEQKTTNKLYMVYQDFVLRTFIPEWPSLFGDQKQNMLLSTLMLPSQLHKALCQPV